MHLVAPENDGGLHFKHESSLSSLLILPSSFYAIFFFFHSPSCALPCRNGRWLADIILHLYVHKLSLIERKKNKQKMKLRKWKKLKKTNICGRVSQCGFETSTLVYVCGWIGGECGGEGQKSKGSMLYWASWARGPDEE